MKSITLLIFITLLLWPGFAKAQHTYSFYYRDTVDTWMCGAIEDESGNINVAITKETGLAFSQSTIHSGLILSINSMGHTSIRQYHFGDTLFSFSNFYKLNAGGYLLSGRAKAPGSDEYMFMIMKTNDELNKIWAKFYDFPDDYFVSIEKTYELPNGITMAGIMRYSNEPGAKIPFFLRINPEGDLLAQYIYDDATSSPFDFLLSPDSSELWCFSSYGLDPINGPSLTAFDTAFFYLYSKEIPDYSLFNIEPIWYANSTIILAFNGQRPGAPYQDDEHSISLYDTSFNLLHANYFGAPDTNDYPAWFQSVDFRHTDSIFFAGWKNHDWGYPSPNAVSWIMTGQLDSTLQPRYLHFIGGDAYYETYYILATRDGGCLITARRWDPERSLYDLLFIKLNNEGVIVGTPPSGIEVRQALVYPNPASDWLTVETALQDSRIEIYNTRGKLVLSHQIQEYKENIHVRHLQQGAYIYKILTKNGEIETGKFIKN